MRRGYSSNTKSTYIVAIFFSVLCVFLATNSYVHLQKANIFANILPNTFADFTTAKVIEPIENISVQYNLYIPKIDVKSDVASVPPKYWHNKQWQQLEYIMQESMAMVGTVAYPHSVQPGNNGKIFITAHSSPTEVGAQKTQNNTLFERLPELLPSDQLYLTLDGVMHEYAVESSQIVSPNKAELLEQKYDTETVVLITCYPVGSTKDRLIIRAKKVRTISLT